VSIVRRGSLVRWFAGTATWLALACVLQAHDIPADITLQSFIKPDRASLKLLVRVPLRRCAM
jgi:hypothetical protein